MPRLHNSQEDHLQAGSQWDDHLQEEGVQEREAAYIVKAVHTGTGSKNQEVLRSAPAHDAAGDCKHLPRQQRAGQ